MIRRRLLGLTVSELEIRILSVLTPFMWVVLALATYLAFAKGNFGEGIAHVGLLMVLFSGMTGPLLWGIVSDTDVMLKKVLAMVTALGFLTMATGWLIRLTT